MKNFYRKEIYGRKILFNMGRNIKELLDQKLYHNKNQ